MFCLQTHVHADLESLHKEVPKRLLPLEYGGEAGPQDVLIGESGVSLFWISKLKKKQGAFCRNKMLQHTQARPTFYVAHFDIETQLALKPLLSLNLFNSRT
jgi:hypothetical protein